MARADNQPVPPRQQFLLFLQGAFAATHGEYYGPSRREALQHFLEGQYAVSSGCVVVGDKAEAQDFIDQVERGVWPAQRQEASL